MAARAALFYLKGGEESSAYLGNIEGLSNVSYYWFHAPVGDGNLFVDTRVRIRGFTCHGVGGGTTHPGVEVRLHEATTTNGKLVPGDLVKKAAADGTCTRYIDGPLGSGKPYYLEVENRNSDAYLQNLKIEVSRR